MDERLKEIVDNFDNMKIGVDEPFQFHCTMCGKCCINREDILLTPKDIYSMSKELGIEPKELFDKYCETYVGKNSCVPIVRLKPRGTIKRCPLLKNRKCSVHEAKPAVCAMFPIGRGVILKEKQESAENLTVEQTQFIFTNPGCGDHAETHTVREWFGKFGIPIEDEFFIKWQKTVLTLGEIFRTAEKTVSEDIVELGWMVTFVNLYLNYSTAEAFLPQFFKNADETITAMRLMPSNKGGVNNG